MEIKAEYRHGEEDTPWRPNLLTAILQIVLFPVAILVYFIAAALLVLYDFLSMGSQHIVLRATPKKILMPDGTIRSHPTP